MPVNKCANNDIYYKRRKLYIVIEFKQNEKIRNNIFEMQR